MLGLGRLDRIEVFVLGDDLTNLDEDIDLFAKLFLTLLRREVLGINGGGGLFATLLRGFLFLHLGRGLRAFLVKEGIIRLVNQVVLLVIELIRVLLSLRVLDQSGH